MPPAGRLRRVADRLGSAAGGHLFEIVIASLLGVAALATAFAAYRASLQDGTTVQSYSEGIALINLATQSSNEGTQTLIKDEAVFLEYVKSIQTDDDELAAYILTTLMRPQLQKAVEWWSKQPDNDKYPTPFTPDNPSYRIAPFVDADQYATGATGSFDAAEASGKEGDRYTLVTVVLAASLFLLGVAGVTRIGAVRLAFTVLGAVFLVASIVQLGRIYWS